MGLVAELHLRPRSGIKREDRLEEEARKEGGRGHKKRMGYH